MLRLFTAVFCVLLMATAADAQPAAKQTTQKSGTAAAENVPEAMQHMVKAPKVDIEAMRDPFASYLSRMAERSKEILAARRATSRPHEELENFDLSTLQLVAVMRMGKRRVAMVQDSTGKGYMVRVGSYMGKNNGRVKKITDDSLMLVEQVVNPAGDIVNHKVTLTLKEVNQ
jgi:type IV pilus assembly protein PilP